MAQGYYEGYHPPQTGRIAPAAAPAPGYAPAYASPQGHRSAAVRPAPGPGYMPGPGHAAAGQGGAGYGHPAAAPQGPTGAQNNARRVGRLVNLAGAALSVALVAGVGVWSYRLMVRDVTGVPVIRALAGPARISPEDPGGRQAAYQGLAVNTVAAEGGAGGAAQSIALAPQPVALTEEDRSAGVLAASGARTPAPTPAPAGSMASAIESALGAVGNLPIEDGITTAPVELADNEGMQILPASMPGISRSPLPRRRGNGAVGLTPAALTTTTLAVASPVAAPAPAPAAGGTGQDAQAEALLQELVTRLGSPRVTEIDPGTLSPGTRLVQLGVYDDENAARAAWDRISTRFPSFLEDRGRIVEAASSGGRVFYRLRAAGFADEPEARRFCTMLVAENVDCIPTLIR